MGIYFGFGLPSMMRSRMKVIVQQFDFILTQLNYTNLIDSPTIPIELWKGFPLETIGGKKLTEYPNIKSLQSQIENWEAPADFYGISPYQSTSTYGQVFSIHVRINLNLEIDETPVKFPCYLSAPAEHQSIYGDIYLESFFSHDHYFDQMINGNKKYQNKNRVKMLSFLSNARESMKFKRITAGRDISVNENIGKAIYVHRSSELDLFKDYIKMAQDYLNEFRSTKKWKPENKLTKKEAKVIAEDLRPYDKRFLFNLMKTTKFYQEKLPIFFKSQKVIIPVPPRSITIYRANFDTLEPVLLKTLKQISGAVYSSLQSKEEVEKHFVEALEEQKFN